MIKKGGDLFVKNTLAKKLFENNENEQINSYFLRKHTKSLKNTFKSNLKQNKLNSYNLISSRNNLNEIKKNVKPLKNFNKNNLFDFLFYNIKKLFSENNYNNFLLETYNILQKTNNKFEKYNNLRLINLFTEELIFFKNNNNKNVNSNNINIEPFIFSMMEMDLFNDYKILFSEEINNEKESSESSESNEKQKNINNDNDIQNFIVEMIENNYEVVENPFFIEEDKIFEILHNFFNFYTKNKISKNGGYINKMSYKLKTETVRENMNTIHNFTNSHINTINSSVKKNFKNQNILFKKSIRKRIRTYNTNDCINESKNKSFIFNFDSKEQKNETLKNLNISNSCIKEIQTNEKYFNPCYSGSDEKYLIFLLKKRKIGDNIFFFSFDTWNNIYHILHLKQLIYNVYGRFEFIINDAGNLSNIISFIYENGSGANNMKNIFKLYFLIQTNILKSNKIFIKKLFLNKINKSKIVIEDLIKKINLFLVQQKTNSNLFGNSQLKNLENNINIKKREISSRSNFNEHEINEIEKYIDEQKNKFIEIIIKKSKLNKLKKIRKALSNKINISSNSPRRSKKNTPNVQQQTELFKKLMSQTIASWGMKMDPGSSSNTNDIQLFSKRLYEKLIQEVFSDLQINDTNIKINFSTKKIEFLKNTKKYNSKFIKKIENMEELISFDIIFKNSSLSESVNFKLTKDLNTIETIKSIIQSLVNSYKNELIKKKSSSNIFNNQIKIIDLGNINFNNIYNQIKSNVSKDTFDSYNNLIKILYKFNYKFNDVVRFILRFKILGDKIQALEAKYNCSLINDYNGINENDIYVKHRILATQDRPLLAYALVENNINFISKVTLDGKKTIFWNFGDAFSLVPQNELTENSYFINYLPIQSLYSVGMKINLNNLQNDNEIEDEQKIRLNNFIRKTNEIKNFIT